MYEVGQIVYSIIEERQILLPLQIIEQVITKNLEGELTQYKVLVPNKNRQKLNLNKFDKVFEDLDDASDYLLKNAKNAIEEMVLKAIELEENSFAKKEIAKKEIAKKENSTCKNEPNKVKIELGDGLVANIDASQLDNINPEILTQEESVDVEKEDSVT